MIYDQAEHRLLYTVKVGMSEIYLITVKGRLSIFDMDSYNIIL